MNIEHRTVWRHRLRWKNPSNLYVNVLWHSIDNHAIKNQRFRETTYIVCISFFAGIKAWYEFIRFLEMIHSILLWENGDVNSLQILKIDDCSVAFDSFCLASFCFMPLRYSRGFEHYSLYHSQFYRLYCQTFGCNHI